MTGDWHIIKLVIALFQGKRNRFALLVLLCLSPAAYATTAQVASGNDHSIGLDANGGLWAWGDNKTGQLGSGDNLTSETPTRIVSDTDWNLIAAGGFHNLALKNDGSLWAWGNNGSGQIGDASTSHRKAPKQIGSDIDWSAIAAGGKHSVALKSDGTLWAWGENSTGQLGDGSTSSSNIPQQIGSDSDWQNIAAGDAHTLAIKNDGSLWAWGSNWNGQLGNASTTQSNSPVQIGTDHDWTVIAAGFRHSAAIKNDGSLWSWGLNVWGQLGTNDTTQRTSPVRVGLDNDWDEIKAAYRHTVAIKTNGTLWAWGTNEYGELGDNSNSSRKTPVQIGSASDWAAISAKQFHTLAVKSDGTFWGWGDNGFHQLGNQIVSKRTLPEQVGSTTDWSEVSGGDFHSVAIKADGSLWSWGYNQYGQLGRASTDTTYATPGQIGSDTDWHSVVAGPAFNLALKTDGSLWAWGRNHIRQLGDGTLINRHSPIQISTASDWVAVAAGINHSLALKTDGTLWAWGYDQWGQLGDGPGNSGNGSHVQVGTDADWAAISAASSHNLALKTDGTLWAWGNNAFSQLGTGNNGSGHKHNPEQIGSDSDWISISTGSRHGFAIKTNGSLWGWGSSDWGELGNGNQKHTSPVQIGSDSDWQSVSASTYFSAALKTDGSLWAWGENGYGQLGRGSISTKELDRIRIGTANDWINIVTGNGSRHSMAMKTDGSLWTWGNNYTRQLGDGSPVAPAAITPINHAPVVQSSGASTTIIADEYYSYTFAASDEDGDTLTYSAPTLPVWLTFNSETGVLSGTPMEIHVGDHNTTLKADDGLLAAQQSFTISVTPARDTIPPQVTAPLDIFIITNEALTEVNLGKASAWDEVDGSLTATPNNTGPFAIGSHIIIWSATDATGNTGSASQKVIITEPDFDGDGIADVRDDDDDNDGLPDGYETSYGLDPMFADDANDDLDGDGILNIDEFILGLNISHDDNPPVVEAPADIISDATGLYTGVTLGQATAHDVIDGELPTAANQTGPFTPGLHQIIWSATDAAGNHGSDIQQLSIRPLVSFTPHQVAEEGAQLKLRVQLNGPAPSYPVIVPFTVSGTASPGLDHNLVDGEISINAGLLGELGFEVFLDDLGEISEYIEVTMGSPENAVPGNHSRHRIRLVEENIAPRVTMSNNQAGKPTTIVVNKNGVVKIKSSVFDPNINDKHDYDWSQSNNILVDNDADDDSFSFDPTTMEKGFYEISVEVTDNGTPPLSTQVTTLVHIVGNTMTLGNDDSDGDGNSDADEGYNDSDGDRIPDYMDDNDSPNTLPGKAGNHGHHVMETRPGLALRIGEIALGAQNHGSEVSADDIEQLSGEINAVDKNFDNVGGLFDFEVDGLSDVGESVDVIIPQRSAIPAGAIYRKLIPGIGWQDFVINDKNQIASAKGDDGYCPPPGSDQYTHGLTAGHWCVQLTIEDGGANDNDGIANGVVVDPGGIGIKKSVDVDDSTQSTEESITPDTTVENNSASIDQSSEEIIATEIVVENDSSNVQSTEDTSTGNDSSEQGSAAITSAEIVDESESSDVQSSVETTASATTDKNSGGGSTGYVLLLLGLLRGLMMRASR